jgi:hypothetical protein
MNIQPPPTFIWKRSGRQWLHSIGLPNAPIRFGTISVRYLLVVERGMDTRTASSDIAEAPTTARMEGGFLWTRWWWMVADSIESSRRCCHQTSGTCRGCHFCSKDDSSGASIVVVDLSRVALPLPLLSEDDLSSSFVGSLYCLTSPLPTTTKQERVFPFR